MGKQNASRLFELDTVQTGSDNRGSIVNDTVDSADRYPGIFKVNS